MADHKPAGASAPAPPQPEHQSTFACPICGVDTPHGHDKWDIWRWLDAQASRFGFHLEHASDWLHQTDGEALDDQLGRLWHIRKRFGDEDIPQTPVVRRAREVLYWAENEIRVGHRDLAAAEARLADKTLDTVRRLSSELEALRGQVQALRDGLHQPGCPTIADDESDQVLADFQQCGCAEWVAAFRAELSTLLAGVEAPEIDALCSQCGHSYREHNGETAECEHDGCDCAQCDAVRLAPQSAAVPTEARYDDLKTAEVRADQAHAERVENNRALLTEIATLRGQIKTLRDDLHAEGTRIDSFHATMGTGYKVAAERLSTLLAALPDSHKEPK